MLCIKKFFTYVIYFIRSCLFNLVFFPYVASIAIVYKFVSPNKYQNLIRSYSRVFHLIVKYLAGIDYKLINTENKKPYPVIYALKHESAWETMALIHVFSPCVFVLKEELTKIPVFGKFLTDVGMIAIDRTSAIQSVRQIVKETKAAVQKGNSIVIFPEGTRAKPGVLNTLQSGIYAPYSINKLPVVPVFLDSGKFWPRKSFLKKSGTVTVDFLEEIKPGLDKDEFMTKLTSAFQNRMNGEK